MTLEPLPGGESKPIFPNFPPFLGAMGPDQPAKTIRTIGMGSHAHVAPVAAPPAMMNMEIPMGSDLVQWELARNTKPPRFDGDPSHWEEFTAEWVMYWDRMSQNGEHSEMTKLQLFQGCLPEELKQEIKLMYYQGQLQGYTQFLAILETRYGMDKRIGARKAWQEDPYPLKKKSVPGIGTISGLSLRWDGSRCQRQLKRMLTIS